jgi:hypothetical protein
MFCNADIASWLEALRTEVEHYGYDPAILIIDPEVYRRKVLWDQWWEMLLCSKRKGYG